MLGISSGASLGVGVVILLTGALTGAAASSFTWWSTIGVSIAAFAGATAVLLVQRKDKQHDNVGNHRVDDFIPRQLIHRHNEILQHKRRHTFIRGMGNGQFFGSRHQETRSVQHQHNDRVSGNILLTKELKHTTSGRHIRRELRVKHQT